MEDTTSELRQRLVEIARSYGGYIGVDNKEMWIAMFERIEKEVAAQKQRWEAEARIAEAQLPQYRYGLKFGMSKELATEITPYCQKRVAELRAALDGVIGEPGDHQSSKKLKAVTKLRKNEQTEMELDNVLLEFLLNHSKAQAHDRLQEHNNADNQAKVALQAWSRQQTAQVLDSLIKQKQYTYDVWFVPVSAIEALRVGLRSAPYSSPSESAKVQGPQVDTPDEGAHP